MGKVEIIIGACLMILSGVFYGITFQFPEQTLAFSPKTFPRFVGICLFILSAILVMQGTLAVRKGLADEPAKPTIDKAILTRLLCGIFIGYIYTQLLPIVGYVVATLPFIAGIMLVFNEKRMIRIGACTIITTSVLYICFRIIFKVPLPRFDLF
jgi:putative tricarboxylic transport membrane protein